MHRCKSPPVLFRKQYSGESPSYSYVLSCVIKTAWDRNLLSQRLNRSRERPERYLQPASGDPSSLRVSSFEAGSMQRSTSWRPEPESSLAGFYAPCPVSNLSAHGKRFTNGESPERACTPIYSSYICIPLSFASSACRCRRKRISTASSRNNCWNYSSPIREEHVSYVFNDSQS